MHKTNCMQSIEIFQYGKYLVAYVLKLNRFSELITLKHVKSYYHDLPLMRQSQQRSSPFSSAEMFKKPLWQTV